MCALKEVFWYNFNFKLYLVGFSGGVNLEIYVTRFCAYNFLHFKAIILSRKKNTKCNIRIQLVSENNCRAYMRY